MKKSSFKFNLPDTWMAVGKLVALVALLILICITIPNNSVHIGRKSIPVEVVSSSVAREKGLSGRDRLAKGRGMLFVYSQAEDYCMWTKDMKFAIDIVWFDESKKVTYVSENVTPETYPKAFCSGQPARYVLEMNAGEASQFGFSIGSQARF
jgi:uncharacterized protein